MRKTTITKAMFTMAFAAVVTTTGLVGTSTYSTPIVHASTSQTETLRLASPTVTIPKRSATTITLKIGKVSGATSYKIYLSSSKNGSYKLAGTTSNASYTIRDLVATKSYYIKVKAVSNTSSSKYSSPVKVNATLAKTNDLKMATSTNGVSLRWSSVSGASKYKVYRSTSKSGEYTYIGSSKTTSYLDQTASAGTRYYYRVRASKTVSETVYNGIYSNKVLGYYTTGNQNGSNNGSNSNGSTGNNGTTNNSGSGNNSSTTSEYATEVLRLINVERAKEGLSALTTTSVLGQAANKRAVEIKSVFSHNRPDGSSCFTVLDDYNISYRTSGENIAYGQKTPAAVVNAWMNSEGHRKNIMSANFGKVGIGCYYSNGTYYWTQLFTN